MRLRSPTPLKLLFIHISNSPAAPKHNHVVHPGLPPINWTLRPAGVFKLFGELQNLNDSARGADFRLLAQTNTTAGTALTPAGSFLMGHYPFFNAAVKGTGTRDCPIASLNLGSLSGRGGWRRRSRKNALVSN